MSVLANITADHARTARHNLIAAANALLAHPGEVHYTQGPNRWEAISRRITIHGGHLFPFYGDCSSTTSWMLWLVLYHAYGVRDLVNGENWRAGYTGTQAAHGEHVSAFQNGKIGDLIFYGGSEAVPEHVAMKIAPGHVFSHGSEAGPFLLPVNYRSDVHPVGRRYFR